MANHGGLLLLVDDQMLIKDALFTYDEGISFHKVRFANKNVYADNIISQPDFKGKHFLIYGKTENQKGFIARMDFSNIYERNCTIANDYSVNMINNVRKGIKIMNYGHLKISVNQNV